MSRRRLVNSYFYVMYNNQRVKKGETVTLSPFAATGGTDSFTVHSSKAWTMDTNMKPSWISASAVNGKRGIINVTVTAATNTDAVRNGSTNIGPTYFLDSYHTTIAFSQNGSSVEYRNLGVDPSTMALNTADTDNGKVIRATVDVFVNNIYRCTTEVTTAVTWTSDNTNVAICQSITDGEVVKPVYTAGQYYPSTRTTTVTASYLGSAATCSVSVAPQGLLEYTLEVLPAAVTIDYNGTYQLTAMLRAYVDGVRDPSRDVNVTTSSTYQVTATSVSDLITIGSDGIVRGQSNPDGGNAIIQASNSNASNTVDVYVTVNPASISEYLEIRPATTSTTWNGTVTYDVYYVKEIAGSIDTRVPITNINDLAFSLRNGTVGEMRGFNFNAANISTGQAYEEISVTCTAGTYNGKSTLTPASLTINGANSVEYYIIIKPQKSALGYSDRTQLEVSGITLVDSYYLADVTSIPAYEVSWNDDSPYASIDNIDNQVWLGVENTTNYSQTCSISGISLSSVGGGAYYNLSATTEVTIERQPEDITYDNLRFCYSGYPMFESAITQLHLEEDDFVENITVFADKYDNSEPLGPIYAYSACTLYMESAGTVVTSWDGSSTYAGNRYTDDVLRIDQDAIGSLDFISDNYGPARDCYRLVTSGLGLNTAMDIDIDATSCVPAIDLVLPNELAGGRIPQSGGIFTVSAVTSCATFIDSSFKSGMQYMSVNSIDRSHIQDGYAGVEIMVLPNTNKERGRTGVLHAYASGYSASGAVTVAANASFIQNSADWEITDADYITFKYNWSGDTGGRDLDTFTFVQFGDAVTPYSDGWSGVGYYRQYTVPQSAWIDPTFKPDSAMLVWAGDNTSTGSEHTLINLKVLCAATLDMMDVNDAYIYIFGNWYSFMGISGNCNIELTAWHGGGPTGDMKAKTGFTFTGSTQIPATKEVSNKCYARRRGNYVLPLSCYTFMSVARYNIPSRTVYLYAAENIDPYDPSFPGQYYGRYGYYRNFAVTVSAFSGNTLLSARTCDQRENGQDTTGFGFSGESTIRINVEPDTLYYGDNETTINSTSRFMTSSCTFSYLDGADSGSCELLASGLTVGGWWGEFHFKADDTGPLRRKLRLHFGSLQPLPGEVPNYNRSYSCDTFYVELTQYLP